MIKLAISIKNVYLCEKEVRVCLYTNNYYKYNLCADPYQKMCFNFGMVWNGMEMEAY